MSLQTRPEEVVDVVDVRELDERADEAHTDVTPRPTAPRITRARALRWAVVIVLLAADLALAITYAKVRALETPVLHLDGSFQTVSGLLRLHAGDLPGRDFFPYLGIGPVFLLYPSFIALGGTLAASVFSAYFFTAVMLALLVGVVMTLSLRARSVPHLLGWAGIPLLLLLLCEPRFSTALPPEVQLPGGIRAALDPLLALGVPGNSLRPIRSAASMLLVAASVLALVRLPRRWAVGAVGACFGTVMSCWSNDYALAPSVVVLAFVVHHGVRARRWRLRELGVLGASLIGTFVVVGLVATGGHYLDYARYNFIDVLGDQFWYFGGWDASNHVYTIADLQRFILAQNAQWGIPLLIGLALLVAVRPSLRWSGVAATGWATFAGGTVATVGGHYEEYYLPFRCWTVVAAVAIGAALVRRLVHRAAARRVRLPAMLRRAATAVGVAVVIGSLAAGAAQGVAEVATQRAFLKADPGHRYAPEYGGFLPTAFQDHVRAVPAAGTFGEEYAGLWTTLRGPDRHIRVDAVIHALGTERVRFARYVANVPTTYVTTAPEISPEWVSWNISANWGIYRTLFHRFTPRQTSPFTVVWTRTGAAAPGVAGTCRPTADGQSISVEPGGAGLNEVTVRYRGPGRGSRSFSMLRNNISSPIDAGGFVALDPAATSQALPIKVDDRSPVLYELRNTPARRLTTITGCSVRTVPQPDPGAVSNIYSTTWSVDYGPVDHTDADYVNGLGRSTAVFLVANNIANYDAYRVGGRVEMHDGTTRRIVAMVPYQNMIGVHLDGAPLPRALATGPKPFTPLPASPR